MKLRPMTPSESSPNAPPFSQDRQPNPEVTSEYDDLYAEVWKRHIDKPVCEDNQDETNLSNLCQTTD